MCMLTKELIPQNSARSTIFLTFILKEIFQDFIIFTYVIWPLEQCVAKYFGILAFIMQTKLVLK